MHRRHAAVREGAEGHPSRESRYDKPCFLALRLELKKLPSVDTEAASSRMGTWIGSM